MAAGGQNFGHLCYFSAVIVRKGSIKDHQQDSTIKKCDRELSSFTRAGNKTKMNEAGEVFQTDGSVAFRGLSLLKSLG